VVLAHGTRVGHVQESAQAVQNIYRQNTKLQSAVEILRVAWAKKLLRADRKTGPLHISVAELEQANGRSRGHNICAVTRYGSQLSLTIMT
jgi:hypothetical protein